MVEFRIIPLGVGDAFTTRHYKSCVALGADDFWILIDCPHPVRKMLREGSDAAGLPLDIDRISGLLLSHLHADHSSGVEDFGFFSYFALRRRARLLAHSEVAAKLWDGMLAGGMEMMHSRTEPPRLSRLDDYFEISTLSEREAVAFGPFLIECRKTIHSIPTTAFRVTANGRTVGFSADTAYDPSLISWLESCDVIVHEVTTASESMVHTPYRQLASLPSALRARMKLTHYPDDFDLAASVIEPLREGCCYEI